MEVSVKWNGQAVAVTLPDTATVGDLKARLHVQLGVLPKRQKLMGIKPKKGGDKVSDDSKLADLKLKKQLMLMGSVEKDIEEKLAEPTDAVEVVDDFEIEEEIVKVSGDPDNLAKIAKRVASYDVEILAPPRPGKRLLVLDIDYTLYDHRSNAESFGELTRPFLHEFLKSAYEDYDIAIWSATSMKWIDVKLAEMGITAHTDYKIAFKLDSRAMITVNSPKYGVVEVKPLGVIWGKFPDIYTPSNTIMFDDIRRNFSMNPGNGLKIRPCRNLPLSRADEELPHLATYLKAIAGLPAAEFAALDHRKWERAIGRKAPH